MTPRKLGEQLEIEREREKRIKALKDQDEKEA